MNISQPQMIKNISVGGFSRWRFKQPAPALLSRNQRQFSWKQVILMIALGWLLSLFLASEAQAVACVASECHVSSTTIDFTVNSNDLTASNVTIVWTPYMIFNGIDITVNYTKDSDESVGYIPNPPNTYVEWIAGPMYPTQGGGGAITQSHTFKNITFNSPAGVCQGTPKPLGYIMATARVSITDSANNTTTTNFSITFDCPQDPPKICRSGGGQVNCDGGCSGVGCTPVPVVIPDSMPVYGYCQSPQLKIKYILYCVKADGTLKEELSGRYGPGYPGAPKEKQCNVYDNVPDTDIVPTPDDIYMLKGVNPDCQTYEIQACQKVDQAIDCSWYTWRYTFNTAPWLRVKGGSLRSEKKINLADSPPAGQCSATYTISAKETITPTARNSDCSGLSTNAGANVLGNVISGQTQVLSSRGSIDIASILKGRFGKVKIRNDCNLPFSNIKTDFDNFDVVVLRCLTGDVTVTVGGADTMDNALAGKRGNKTILVQNNLIISGTSLAYDTTGVDSPNRLASLGWIVQKADPNDKSNLNIDQGITNLAGTFYVNGNISTGASATNPLTVQGSMVAVGPVSSLGRFDFERTVASASFASETIWDDGRSWLNPPPGFVNILSGLPHNTSLQVSPDSP